MLRKTLVLTTVLFAGCGLAPHEEAKLQDEQTPVNFDDAVGTYQSDKGAVIEIKKIGNKLVANVQQFNVTVDLGEPGLSGSPMFQAKVDQAGCNEETCKVRVTGFLKQLVNSSGTFAIAFWTERSVAPTSTKELFVPTKLKKAEKPKLWCFTKFMNGDFEFGYEGTVVNGTRLDNVRSTFEKNSIFVAHSTKGHPHRARDPRYKDFVAFDFENAKDSYALKLLLPIGFENLSRFEGFVRDKASDGGATSKVICSIKN